MANIGKRVLFIHHGSAFGGAALSLLYTALGVRKNGYEPIIALIEPSKELHYLYNNENIKTLDLTGFPRYFYCSGDAFPLNKWIAIRKILGGIYKYRGGARSLNALLDRVQPDIVHLNSVTLVLAVLMMRGRREELVWHIREYGPPFNDFRLNFISSKMKKVKKIIFLSEGERSSWIGSEKKGIVVNNFVDFSQFTEDFDTRKSREKLKIENIFTILYVGGLKQNKSPELLIRTLKVLKDKGRKVQCIMPGAISLAEAKNVNDLTDYEEECLCEIRQLELLEECIRFPFLPDIRDFYAAADVLVFPTKFPHFARPVVEAGAMKKPVVVSNLKPLDELVINGGTGFLADLTAKSFAEKIELLIDSPELGQTLGANGRKFALNRFDAKIQVGKIVAYYES